MASIYAHAPIVSYFIDSRWEIMRELPE